METRSTKMSLIKPTLIKPTQIRSALFSNLHFYYCANIACKGFHLPISEGVMQMIRKKPHVGPWREKYPRLRLNKKKGFPPDFPVPYLLPGSCISYSAKHLLLTHDLFCILCLVACIFCYVLSVYSSILLTNCSTPRGACKWYSASFESKWESLTLCLQTLRRHVWNVKSLIGLWHWLVSDI